MDMQEVVQNCRLLFRHLHEVGDTCYCELSKKIRVPKRQLIFFIERKAFIEKNAFYELMDIYYFHVSRINEEMRHAYDYDFNKRAEVALKRLPKEKDREQFIKDYKHLFCMIDMERYAFSGDDMEFADSLGISFRAYRRLKEEMFFNAKTLNILRAKYAAMTHHEDYFYRCFARKKFRSFVNDQKVAEPDENCYESLA